MERIKILQLTESGCFGGNQTKILSLLKNIDREKFQMAVAAKGGHSFEAEVHLHKIPFYNIELPKVLRTRYLNHLQEIHNIEHFDIVHSHGSVAGFYGRTLKKHNPGIKSVHSIHGIHYLNNPNIILRNVSKSVEQYLVQYTDMTVCENQSDYKIGIENRIIDSEKTVVISNGIDITKFVNRKKNTELMYTLGLNENHFVIGNVSRFDVQKNQMILIQAAYYLVRKYPQMRFVFVGDGHTLKTMKQFAKDSNLENYIVFTGEVEEAADYYPLFDIFILPSMWDGMPYALLEAIASRLPVICSKLGNNLEIIKNNYSALTINSREMDDIFQKISVLYQNRELREKIAQNALIESTQYDETETVRKFGEVYIGVINN